MKTAALVLVFAISLQLALSDDSTNCATLNGLVENINPSILEDCRVGDDCTSVHCNFNPMLGEMLSMSQATITVLPCAFPRPSLNILILNTAEIVVANVTSYKSKENQMFNMLRLDWTIQYNEAEETLIFQLNENETTPIVRETTISLDRSGCADCPGLKGLVKSINPTILGVCAVRTPCTSVSCVDSPFPALITTITVLPCTSPRPSINFLIADANEVVGNHTSDKSEVNEIFGSLIRLNWTIHYNEAEESLMFQAHGGLTIDLINIPSATIVETTSIPVDRSMCADNSGAPEMKLMLSVAMLSLLIALLV